MSWTKRIWMNGVCKLFLKWIYQPSIKTHGRERVLKKSQSSEDVSFVERDELSEEIIFFLAITEQVVPGTFSSLESQCVSTSWTVFLTRARTGKFLFDLFVNIWQKLKLFLTERCFFMYITNSSVNFAWFALFSHQEFDDRPLFEPEILCLIFHQFE